MHQNDVRQKIFTNLKPLEIFTVPMHLQDAKSCTLKKQMEMGNHFLMLLNPLPRLICILPEPLYINSAINECWHAIIQISLLRCF